MRPTGWTGGWALAAAPMLLFLLVPLAMLVLARESGGLPAALSSPEAIDAMRLSLETTGIALLAVIALGTPLAILVARHRFPGCRIVDALIDLPIVLPPAVAGVALLLAFGRQGPIGSFLNRNGIEIVFTPVAVVMAQVFVASPYYVRAAATALRLVSPEIEAAAALDGAGPMRLLASVLIPITAAPLLSGIAMTWSRALGEFGATLLFAGNLQGRTQTMPLAIYLGFESGSGAPIALSVLLIAVAFSTLMVTRWLAGRSWGIHGE